MLRQERLLWKLQELKIAENKLWQSGELKAVVGKLKELQEKVKEGEKELQTLLQMIERTEKEVHVLEEKSGNLARQIEINKEKLYQAKGSSLKELLSLQQSVLNLETEGEETEEKYWQLLKKIEACKSKKEQYQEMVKVWQEEFQDGVNEYQAVKNQAGLKIAEIKSKQEEICEQLWPEIKVAYQEVEKQYPFDFVAKLHQGSCLGCYIGVSAVLKRSVVEAKKVQYCDHCGRILINYF
jgi:predicted  nucleic acid-binding Zn-ribbon protein